VGIIAQAGLTCQRLLPTETTWFRNGLPTETTTGCWRPCQSPLLATSTASLLSRPQVQSDLRPDRRCRSSLHAPSADRLAGEGVSVEAYNPASRRGHLKDDDADEGIGLFEVHTMGWRLSPGREPDSPRNRRRRSLTGPLSTHESALAAAPTGNGLRIRWAGVRIPPGAPLFPVGCPSPILAEASNTSFSEWRRRRQSMCQMPAPSARIVRCSCRPN